MRKIDIIKEVIRADNLLQSLSIFINNRSILRNYKFIFLEDGKSNIPQYTQKRYFSDGALIYNIFANERLIFLDDNIVNQMECGNAMIKIDYSVSLDTQGISCLEPYLKKKDNNRLPKDFKEVLNFLVENNVNIDPMPYIIENIHNIKNKDSIKRIKEKLKAYEVLKNIDIEQYQENNKVVTLKSEMDIEKEIEAYLDLMIEFKENYYKEIEGNYNLRYCLLLNMILINLKSKKSANEKLYEFIEFCNSEIFTISLRELIIADRYFKIGQNFRFFGKIQKGRVDIELIKNMAWDLYHISELEIKFLTGDEEADYNIQSFLTFDKRLIEMIELYSLKAICVSKDKKEIYPFYDMRNFVNMKN